MARSRNIKPGFFRNEILAEIEPLGRLLFAGLWILADREGRLEDRPKRIKVDVLPYDNCDVNKLLDDLADKNFIIRYKANGCNYIQIVNFVKHQNPHKNEVASVIPSPEEIEKCPEEIGSDTEEIGTTPADSLLLDPDSFNLDIQQQQLSAREEIYPAIQTGLQKAGILIPSPVEMDSLIDWTNHGIEPDAILYAIEKAALAGHRRVDYINGTLRNWIRDGIKTKLQAEAEQVEFEQQKARGDPKRRRSQGPGDRIPRAYSSVDDWAKEDSP